MVRYLGGEENVYIVRDDPDYAYMEWAKNKKPTDTLVVRSLIKFGESVVESMIGHEFDFYGAESKAFKVGDSVIEVLEDPDDGLRCYLGGFLAHNTDKFNFYSKPFAKVRLENYSYEKDVHESERMACGYDRYEFEGFRLVGVDCGHVWLEFGTDYSHDYYPMFVFSYMPKESV